jgi:hypothetical protein
MPIKMNFLGDDVANHGGSIPIGHITKMDKVELEDRNEIHAEAMLWKDEFPDEIAWLKTAYAANNAPGLSYEIDFEDSEMENDTQWIKGTTTLAATFVKNPAYGTRTHLLALASLDEDKRNKGILALADILKADEESDDSDNNDEGGNLMEEELEKAKAEVTRLLAELTKKDEEISGLKETLTKTEDEKNTATAELEKIQLESKINDRIRQYVEAGFIMETDATKADARKSVFASFEDAQWDTYLADLKAAKPKDTKRVAASLNLNDVPKIDVDIEEGVTGLRDEMRILARPHSI